MSANRNIAIVLGVLTGIQIALGVLINEVLLGPVTFAKDYLTQVSAHSNEVMVSMMLGFINEAISIGIAAMLLPIFRKHSETLAFTFLALTVAGFGMVVADNVSVQSLLTLSREYVKAGAPASEYFQTAGAVCYATRLWTHLAIMLVSGLPLSVFYYLFFTSRLIPRFISVWGLIGTVLMFIAVVMMIFDKGSYMALFLPLGLNQMFLAVWLVVRGFKAPAVV
jgi:hypothetical protein